jgi:transposase
MAKSNTASAGIDVGKYKLDVAIDGSSARAQFPNTAEGHKALSAWLRKRRVERVGLEASGGYEQLVVTQLRRDKFKVIVFQPARVRAYAMFRGQFATGTRRSHVTRRSRSACSRNSSPPYASIAISPPGSS